MAGLEPATSGRDRAAVLHLSRGLASQVGGITSNRDQFHRGGAAMAQQGRNFLCQLRDAADGKRLWALLPRRWLLFEAAAGGRLRELQRMVERALRREARRASPVRRRTAPQRAEGGVLARASGGSVDNREAALAACEGAPCVWRLPSRAPLGRDRRLADDAPTVTASRQRRRCGRYSHAQSSGDDRR